MKNIHVLPTDKLSSLYLGKNGNFVFGMMQTSVQSKNDHFCNQHIYITNDEEIKEGDWCLDINIKLFKHENHFPISIGQRKIILTTDTELIKDGVQAIDDEFLEWFVNNPSCEEVEVELYHGIKTSIAEISAVSGNDDYNWKGLGDFRDYKLIIPKEEPKQIYYNTVGIENGVNVVKGQFNTQKEALDLANELNRKFPDLYYDWRETLIKEEPKHETVEEAAEINCESITHPYCDREKSMFIKGAKWQSERMYSEEEVIKIIYQLHLELQTDKDFTFMKVDEWFEQFKKK